MRKICINAFNNDQETEFSNAGYEMYPIRISFLGCTESVDLPSTLFSIEFIQGLLNLPLIHEIRVSQQRFEELSNSPFGSLKMSTEEAPPALVINESKSVIALERAIYSQLDVKAGGEVEALIGIRWFDESTHNDDVNYDQYTVAITRAKLSRAGYESAIKIMMDSKACRTVLAVWPQIIYAEKQIQAEIKKKWAIK